MKENYIRKNCERVSWIKLSECNKLSEEFIRKFKDEVNWCSISACQVYNNLSLSEKVKLKRFVKIGENK